MNDIWKQSIIHDFMEEDIYITNILFSEWIVDKNGYREITTEYYPRAFMRWFGFKPFKKTKKIPKKKYKAILEFQGCAKVPIEISDDSISNVPPHIVTHFFWIEERRELTDLTEEEQLEEIWQEIILEVKGIYPEIKEKIRDSLAEIHTKVFLEARDLAEKNLYPVSPEENNESEEKD